MKVKALSLIFLVAGLPVTTSIVLRLPAQAIEVNAGFCGSHKIKQLDGGVDTEPDGKEIDSPGMPT